MSQARKRNNYLVPERLVVVSNRLPIVLTRRGKGQWQVQPSTSGLVTALTPILRQQGGLWIGWPGTLGKVNLDKLLAADSPDLGYTLKPVWLTKEESQKYYFGFSNEVIWPLCHDLITRCNFDPAYWDEYQTVNRKFARVVAKNISPDDYIWVHDYHLMLVAKELRSMGVDNKLGFFLHTPFPPLDIWVKLPWRKQILEALLEHDLIGFQTRRDRNNFTHCVEVMLRGLHIDARRQIPTVTTPEREVRIGSFPISIDFRSFAQQAASKDVAENARRLRVAMPEQQIILGVDRLDYSKGIPEKLQAFRNALKRFRELRGKVTLVQIVVPSRQDIPEYQALRSEIEGLVSEINGVFTRLDWIPVHYMYRILEQSELLAYYRVADIALITSLKDGMNLVAKEYCSCDIDESGVLILSEFTGASYQLHRNSLLVNPYDLEGVADAIHRAYNMSTDERQLRMRRLRQSIAKRDIFWWVNFFFQTAMAKESSN